LGSPITFSGFNNIDFNMILNAVMAQERQPLTRLETQKSTLETQNSQFATLAGKLSTMESAVDTLKGVDSLSFLTATSSDAGVGVTSTGGRITGTYDVIVTDLAKAQVTASGTYTALTDSVNTSGSSQTLTLTPGNGDPATAITVTAGMTLEQLATAINGSATSPAAASIVQTSPGVYKLVLTGKETGTTNAFTVGQSAGLTMTFADTQTAINAAFTVNGLAVSSASNTVTDVIDGVTLSLFKKDPSVTATVKVERDITKAKDTVKKFVNAYNDIITFAKDQAAAAVAGRASIGRDPLLRSLRETLRKASMDDYTGSATYTKLAEIGIGFDTTGKMILDDEVFEDQMANSPSEVQNLLSGPAGDAGAFGAFKDLIEGYTQSGGLVAKIRERIDTQTSSMSKRLDSMEEQLELRRRSLQQQYIAADLAMTRLKSQSSALSSAGSGYRLF
jgi:flagellar hook-associated protein 2